MSLLADVVNAFSEYSHDENYIYKKCHSPHSLVLLCKLATSMTTEQEISNSSKPIVGILQNQIPTIPSEKKQYENDNFTFAKIAKRVIVNDRYAQFRANELFVKKILSLPDLTEISCAHSLRQSYFEYRVGEIVKSDMFEQNNDIVSAEGIHYFKSAVAALCFGFHVPGVVYEYYDGVWYDFNYNGKLLAVYNLKSGTLYGKQTVFLDDGSVLEYDKS